MKRIILVILALTVFAVLTSCSGGNVGGTEAGNPSMRSVIGLVQDSSSSNLLRFQTGAEGCPADTVIAVDSLANTTSATLNSDCSFTMNLTINKSYAINFVLNDQFVASMIFTNSSTSITSSTFILSDGDTDINLGNITIDGEQAVPQTQPSQQNDRDDDGIFDFEDEFEDEDCDLDGYYDLFDEDDDECEDEDEDSIEDEDETPTILDVYPENDDTNIDIEDSIEVQFGCSVDTDSVNATTFSITSDSDTVICDFESSSSDQIMTCAPQDDLEANTTYTVTLNGIECEIGSSIPDTSWTFTTGNSN